MKKMLLILTFAAPLFAGLNIPIEVDDSGVFATHWRIVSQKYRWENPRVIILRLRGYKDKTTYDASKKPIKGAVIVVDISGDDYTAIITDTLTAGGHRTKIRRALQDYLMNTHQVDDGTGTMVDGPFRGATDEP